jgi:hypothetical protein
MDSLGGRACLKELNPDDLGEKWVFEDMFWTKLPSERLSAG